MICVQGDGMAAEVCAVLLARAEIEVAQTGAGGPKVPVILVPAATERLYADVMGRALGGCHRIRKRVVMWGSVHRVELPHLGLVVEDRDLGEIPGEAASGSIEWTVACSPRFREASVCHSCGSRSAWVTPVELTNGSPRDTCWMESLAEGWVFLIPSGALGWLIFVGAGGHDAIRESTLVAGQVSRMLAPARSFPAAPAVTLPLARPGWLAAGSAALRFDPLCGDGTGHAIREAILASAVVRAARKGENPEALARHYENRLLGAFQRHLADCLKFYQSGGTGPWWREQQRACEAGLALCAERLRDARFAYRLSGFDLLPIS